MQETYDQFPDTYCIGLDGDRAPEGALKRLLERITSWAPGTIGR